MKLGAGKGDEGLNPAEVAAPTFMEVRQGVFTNEVLYQLSYAGGRGPF